MAERYFEKDGKRVKYSKLKELYGDTTDSIIEKGGLKEVQTQVSESNNQQQERFFTKDGKKVKYSKLKELYGNKTDEVIEKSGLKEEVSLEKHEDFKGESDKRKDYVQNIDKNAENYGYIKPEEKKGIRNIKSTEFFDLGETDARNMLEDQYGKAGFKFEEAVAGMDYVKATAPNGETYTLSLDKMWGHEKEMNKFNDWLTMNSEGLDEEALKSTHEIPQYMKDYYKMQDANQIDPNVLADMERSAADEISEQPLGGKKVIGLFSNQAGDAMVEAEDFYQSPNNIIQNEDGSEREVTEDDIRKKAQEILIDKRSKDHIIEAHHDYFSTWWTDTEDKQEFMQDRNTQRQLDLEKEKDQNIENIAKVKRLTNSVNVLSNNFQKHYDNILARRDAGQTITQEEIDSLKAKGQEIQDRLKLYNEIKKPFEELAQKEHKYTEAADYLDNVNGNIENLIKTLGSAGTDLGANVLWGAGAALGHLGEGEALRELGKRGKEWSEEQKGRLQKRGSGTSGGLTAIVEKGLTGVMENAPLLALGMIPGVGQAGVIIGFGASGAIGKHYDMTQEDLTKQKDLDQMQNDLDLGKISINEYNTKLPGLTERYDQNQMILGPLMYGAAESLTAIPEMMMVGGAFRGVSKGFGGPANIFGQSFMRKMGTTILGTAKGFGKAQGSELVQEITTQFGQNGVDKYYLNKHDVQLTDGLDADFVIKTMGSTGTFQTMGNARALAAKIGAGNPMTLDSDNQQMINNSKKILHLQNGIDGIDNQINEITNKYGENQSLTKEDKQKIDALQSQKATVEADIADANKNQEQLINDVLDYSKMGPQGVNKLRELTREAAQLRIEAEAIRNNEGISKAKREQLIQQLQDKYNTIEGKKKQVVENNNTYQLEEISLVKSLEQQAIENIKEKRNGEIPNQKQIEKEASRIFNKNNSDINTRKQQAEAGIRNNVAKYESEGLINRMNAIDPTRPIEKREFNTLKEAKDFITKDMSKKGYAVDSDQTIQAIQEIEQNWDNSAASILQPEILQDGQRQLDPKTSTFDKHQTVIVNKKKAATDPGFQARGHDVFHGMLWKAFKSSGQGFQNIADGLVTHVNAKDQAGAQWLNDELTQLSPDDANYHEEVIAKIADGMRNGQIKVTPDIGRRVGSLLKQSGQALGIDTELMINDPADMFELIDSYNRNLKSSGRLSGAMKSAMEQGVAVDPKLQPKRQVKPDVRITKQYKQDKAFENKIQNLYEQGKEFEITEAYRPRVERILEAEWKNFLEANNIRKGDGQYDLVVDEVLTGDRGILDIIKDYKPGKVPLSGYIGSIMQKRGISEQVFKIVPDTQGMYKQEIDAQTKKIADEVIEEVVEAKKDLLKETINLDPSMLNEVVNAVTKTFGLDLGDIKSPQFAKKLADNFKLQLGKKMKDMLGKRADYQNYLENNWENIWKSIPQDVVNKSFPELKQEVLTKEGKQARAKTKAGRRIFKKKKLTKKEFMDYFNPPAINPKTGKRSGLAGTRKQGLANAIAETLARDEVMDVLSNPEVAAKFEQINELLNRKLPKNWKSYVQKAIDVIDASIAEINDPGTIMMGPPKSVMTGFLKAVKAGLKAGKNFLESVNAGLDKHILPWLKSATSLKKALEVFNSLKNNISFWNEPRNEVESKEQLARIKDILENTDIKATSVEFVDATTKLTLEQAKEKGISEDAYNELQDIVNDKEVGHVINGKKHKAGADVTGKFADDMFYVLDNLPPTIHKILGNIYTGGNKYGIFGLQWGAINVSDSADARNAPNYHRDKFFEGENVKRSESYAKPKFKTDSTYKYPKEIQEDIKQLEEYNKNGKIQPMNVTFLKRSPMLSKILDVVGVKGAVEAKIKKIMEIFDPEVARANKLLGKTIAKILKHHYKKGDIDLKSLYMLLKEQSNTISGWRALGGIMGLPVTQAEIKINKGEHVDPNTGAMTDLLQYMMSDTMTDQDLENILDKDQLFANKEKYLDPVDDKLGTTVAGLGIFRITKGLGKRTANQFIMLNEGGQRLYDVAEKKAKQEAKINKENKAADTENNTWLPKDMSLETGKLWQKALKLFEKGTFDLKKAPHKGITVVDFDQTVANTTEKVIVKYKDGTSEKINAQKFAKTADQIVANPNFDTFDFSEFEKVKNAKPGPVMERVKELAGKYGTEQIHILTARPQAAALAIQAFMKSNGLDIKLENITGLESAKPELKRDFIIGKLAEGFNDFFFSDDHLGNVQEVKKVLDKLDVKSEVYQAEQNFKKDLDKKFNKILEENTDLPKDATVGLAKAKLKGAKTGGWFKNFWIPYSAEDFSGLLYALIGKGKKGESQWKFFKKALIDPFAKAVRNLNAFKQTLANELGNLKRQYPDVTKALRKDSGVSDYNNAHAIRVYNWNKAGYTAADLNISQADFNNLIKHVEANPDMRAFSDKLRDITKMPEGYSKPRENGDWITGNIDTDMMDIGFDKREQYLEESGWTDNKNKIFSKENMQKLEYTYGDKFVEALEDMLYRMENGINRPKGSNRLVNEWQHWVNNSVGAIMFFNIRSALLQTLSATNFINWSDNNPVMAAKAMLGNPKQFWKDFSFIFNHPTLKQRRAGMDIDVNAQEIARRVVGSKNPISAALNYLLQLGFTPTRIADSFAIASGGASMYRNRINTYLKKGFTQEAAEKQAWLDFQEISEATQQSARPDMISEQQASSLGRLILAFQVTPMQYARLMKRAGQDLVNRRRMPGMTQAQSDRAYMSKILYYAVAQNIIFNAMQKALFALMFAADEEDEEETLTDKEKKKLLNGVSGAADSILRGLGVGGAVVSTLKNMVIKFLEQDKRGYRADHAYTLIEGLNVSPPIGSKARKIYSGFQTHKFNKNVMKEMGLDIDNPAFEAISNLVSGTTNVPLDRVLQNVNNVRNALDKRNEAWQRLAMLMGYPSWQVDVPKREVEAAREEVKRKKAEEKKRKKEEEKRKKQKK